MGAPDGCTVLSITASTFSWRAICRRAIATPADGSVDAGREREAAVNRRLLPCGYSAYERLTIARPDALSRVTGSRTAVIRKSLVDLWFASL